MIAPDTCVVYVDNDPIVMAYARASMPQAVGDSVGYVLGDLRQPRLIMEDPALAAVVDLQRPYAVLLLAMPMSIPDEQQPYQLVSQLLGGLPSGSYLAITHTSPDFNPAAMGEHVLAATEAGMPFTPRNRAEVEQFFDRLELVDPGVVPIVTWRPYVRTMNGPNDAYIYAGLGCKP